MEVESLSQLSDLALIEEEITRFRADGKPVPPTLLKLRTEAHRTQVAVLIREEMLGLVSEMSTLNISKASIKLLLEVMDRWQKRLFQRLSQHH